MMTPNGIHTPKMMARLLLLLSSGTLPSTGYTTDEMISMPAMLVPFVSALLIELYSLPAEFDPDSLLVDTFPTMMTDPVVISWIVMASMLTEFNEFIIANKN